MKISLGCDEAAFDLKEAIKKHLEDADMAVESTTAWDRRNLPGCGSAYL